MKKRKKFSKEYRQRMSEAAKKRHGLKRLKEFNSKMEEGIPVDFISAECDAVLKKVMADPISEEQQNINEIWANHFKSYYKKPKLGFLLIDLENNASHPLTRQQGEAVITLLKKE